MGLSVDSTKTLGEFDFPKMTAWESSWATIKDYSGSTLANIRTLLQLVGVSLGAAGSVGAGYQSTGPIPAYATGGVVPGFSWQPQLAIVHGQERITPNGRNEPMVININANVSNPADAEALAYRVARIIQGRAR